MAYAFAVGDKVSVKSIFFDQYDDGWSLTYGNGNGDSPVPGEIFDHPERDGAVDVTSWRVFFEDDRLYPVPATEITLEEQAGILIESDRKSLTDRVNAAIQLRNASAALATLELQATEATEAAEAAVTAADDAADNSRRS